ncbi:MAG: hypothetical protein WCJ19_04465 [bacterium]
MIKFSVSKNNFCNILKETLKNNGFMVNDLNDNSASDNEFLIFFQDPYLDDHSDYLNKVSAAIENCRKEDAFLIYIDTIHLYGYSETTCADENYRHLPISNIAKLRENAYLLVKESCIKKTIIRLPDILGYGCNYFFNDFFNGWASNFLKWPASTFINHEFIFSDDAAKILLNVIDKVTNQPNVLSDEYNISGEKYTLERIAATINEIIGLPVKIDKLSPFIMWINSRKNGKNKAIFESAFLFQKPLFLCGDKYEKEFGKIISTDLYASLREILRHTTGEKS